MGFRVGVVPGLLALLTLLVGPAWGLSPELPRVFLDTTLVPPTGKTIAVAGGGDVQAALNVAQPGDVITLEAGATFTAAPKLGRRSTIVGGPPSAVPNSAKSLIVVARGEFSDATQRSIVSQG